MTTNSQHIAYVGAVHKGALVFEEVVRGLASTPGLRVTVFGGGDPGILARLRRLPRVTIRGYYRGPSTGESSAAAMGRLYSTGLW